jgi:hypothetical protein
MHPGNPTMLNNSNPLLSKACLTNSNLNHFKMTEAMGLRIIASNGITSLSNLMKIYQAVHNISIDSLHLKASNAFRPFFSLQYTTSSGLHSNIIAFMSSLPYSKLHSLVTTVTSAKDCMWYNHSNPTMQTIPNHCWAGLKIVQQTHSFEPQPF